MQKIVDMSGKPVRVSLSRAAERALAGYEGAVVYRNGTAFHLPGSFERMFRDHAVGDCFQVTDKLAISFKPMMTSSCNIEAAGKRPPVIEFPVAKPEAFSPKWLTIDYRGGEWLGDFGFLQKQAAS